MIIFERNALFSFKGIPAAHNLHRKWFFQIKAGKTYNEFELAEKIDGLRAKMEKFVDLRLGFLEFSLKNQVHEVKRN